MVNTKAIVYRQNIEINNYVYYDSAKVSLKWKNINKNTYYQTVNTYQKYLDTFGNKYESSPQYGLYFSGDAYSKVKLLYNYKINSGYTFVGTEIPVSKSEKSWSTYSNVLTSYFLDFNGYATLEFSRVNSNIYKNIFPEEVFNMDYLNKSFANVIASTNDIRQENHELSVNDFVYFDSIDNKYKKALAEDSARANVVGLVSNVAGPNVFTLMKSGKVTFDTLDYNDTTILYLSDKTPGKAVHYSEISNTVYIPIAIYIENNIIVSLQQGSIGDVLVPYEKEEQDFENYTEQDLNDIITQVTNGVK